MDKDFGGPGMPEEKFMMECKGDLGMMMIIQAISIWGGVVRLL